MIDIFINSEPHSIENNTTVADILAQKNYVTEKIAVAVNKKFVPRSSYQEHIIHDKDTLDIVSPVQGG